MKSLSLTRQLTILVGLLTFGALGVIGLSALLLAAHVLDDGALSQLVHTLLVPMLLIAVLVTVGMAGLAGWFMRSRMKPLHQLTTYARHMGRGDLQTPIDVETRSAEVSSLAQVLDKTRAQLLKNVEAVSEARQLSETLIQSVVEGIITCDAGWRIVFFSAGAARITGWTSESAVGKPLDAVLALSNDESGHFADYLPSDSGRRTVAIRHLIGGTITLAVTRAKPITEGQTTIVIHDISEETHRRKAQTYFLASMSHEFRTPLAGMQASIELLQENLRQFSVEETQQLLNSIHLSLSMLHQLIELIETFHLPASDVN